MTPASEKSLHRAFILTIWIKAFNGTVQILCGIALLLPGTSTTLAGILVRIEFIRNPHNFVTAYLQRELPVFLAGPGWFAIAFLLSHGLLKIFLAAGLLKRKLWAYPSAMVVFALFIAFQLYRYHSTRSVFLLLLTVVDLIVIWLTWHEYRRARKHPGFLNPHRY